MRKSTERIELVEAGNMAISLRRIYNRPGHTMQKTKRALYYAMQLSELFSYEELARVRVVLGLP